MAKGIKFNVYKRNGERKSIVECIFIARGKWGSDVSKAKLLHEAANQKLVHVVLWLECE